MAKANAEAMKIISNHVNQYNEIMAANGVISASVINESNGGEMAYQYGNGKM